MTFEEYCIKFSRRNIKKYGNGSNYSDVSRKKVELLITCCWIIWNQKIKVHSLGNSSARVRLGGFFEISIFHFFGTLWMENYPQIFAKSANFPFKVFQKSEKLKFRKTFSTLPGENCYLTNELWFFDFRWSSTYLSGAPQFYLFSCHCRIF